MEVYIVIEFDFDGKFADAQIYRKYVDALDAVYKISQMGGEFEILGRNQK